MIDPWQPQFLFAVCQQGAEQALKTELALTLPEARLAYSRPGFVTFKLDQPVEKPKQFRLRSTFARSYGFSLGKVVGERLGDLAEQVWQLPEVVKFLADCQPQAIHVWQRDAAVPGRRGFEPGRTPLAEEVEQKLRQASPVAQFSAQISSTEGSPSSPSPRNAWVLDVVLVEPNQWWIGCHLTQSRQDCWPGGVPGLPLPDHACSRAYLKMAEALEWSGMPLAKGDRCVELGCAPGGAAQRLLEQGMHVIGVDPAEVDSVVLEHPHFEHVRKRSRDVPHKLLRGRLWVMADMNAAPSYTLDAVESIVGLDRASVRGLLLTLKLEDWQSASEVPELVERVQSWGFRDVRTRQLATNRLEICLVALRSRAQRRIRQSSKPRRRFDSAHAGKPASS